MQLEEPIDLYVVWTTAATFHVHFSNIQLALISVSFNA